MATFDAATFSNPVVKAFLAGSMSGTFSTLIFQPLDLMKTRIQQQAELRLSMTGVCKNIVAQENFLGLWRGVIPSLVRTVPGVGLYFSSMHFMKANLCEGRPSHLQSVFIGGSSRAFAGAVMIPFTVIKTRFESNSYSYNTTYQAFKNILKVEGLRGLTSGLGPTLFRDVPFSGLYLMFYEHLKSRVPADSKNYHQSTVHFLCGFVSGILASVLTQPADVIKTKMQLDQANSGLAWTIRKIYRQQGWGGFLTGLAPRMLRRTLMAALAWTVYEKRIKTIGLK